ASVLEGVPNDVTRAPGPGAVLARDRNTTLVVIAGSAIPLALLLAWPQIHDITVLGAFFTIGLTVAIAIFLAVRSTAWPSFVATLAWLALSKKLPWRLMTFLNDAHQRGVLRQAGAVYQFRHIGLQHRLA